MLASGVKRVWNCVDETNSAYRFYPINSFVFMTKFFSQAAYMHIHTPVIGAEVPAEDALGQLLTRHNMTGLSQKYCEKIELNAGQL